MSQRFLSLMLATVVAGAAPAWAQKVKTKVKTKTEQAPAAPAPAPAPPTDWAAEYAATITPDDLRKHLTVLASDAYEGRETGEKGQKMAADYIAARFQELGLTGPVPGSDNPYVQRFQMERSRWDFGQMQLQAGKQRFVPLTDYYVGGGAAFPQATTLQPVFVGYGIEQEGYNDFADLDVTGKDLIVLAGEPLKDGKPLLGQDGKPSKWADSRTKESALMRKKPRSVFYINADAAQFAQLMTRIKPFLSQARLTFPGKNTPVRTTAFMVSPAVGLALLGTDAAGLAKYQAAVAAAGQPVKPRFKPAALTVTTPRQTETITTENVLGLLEGSDKKDELLVVSAHYDHLGMQDGQVFNGADDDGSGTVAVLELAQAFAEAKKAGHGPRRSLLFLTVTGEEKGLLGSEYYVEHPVVPLAQTVADLNIDMIGRIDDQHKPGDEYVELVGSDKLSSELHAISEAANQQRTRLTLGYRYNDPKDPERVYYRSDHYNFAKNKIPVIFYTTGDHADYHQPTDDVDKIEFPLMTKRAHLVFYTAWELANRDNRIVVDSNKP